MPSRTRFVRPGLCALACLLLAAPAGAIPRYKKPTEVKVKPIRAHRARTAKPAEARPTGPRLTVDQFRSTARARVAHLNDRAIEALKRLIRVTSDRDPDKPDLLFRLAEHYRDKKVYHMFAARELDEPIFRARSAPGKRRLKQRRRGHESAERRWLLEAIKVYLRVATHPPLSHYKRMDQVLFNLADMLASSGRRDRALFFFQRLIRNYPKSRYIPDAYLSFAEHYFNAGKVEQALRLYKQVGRFRDSPLYGYALYKQGWCWLNLKDPQRALELFVRVIRDSGRRSASRHRSRIVLIREAKKDAVRAYSHVGAPQRAWPFFQRIGKGYAPRMLEKLAHLYYDQGKYLASILTFRKLIALRPKSKDLCSWQHNVLRGTLSGKDKRQHVVESKRLAAVYDTMKKRGKHKRAVTECRANTSAALRELATTWHRECQVTKNRDTCKLARVLYEEYLERFPGEKDAYRVAFYLAELLYGLEAWRPCAGAYTRVIEMRPRGKHLKEAAYAAVLCWKNALDVARASPPSSSRGGQTASLKPRPIPEAERKMMEAFETYIRVVPRSKELPSIIYQKGRIYYNHNVFGKAADLFERIVTNFSDHEVAPYAAHLMLDCLNILKQRTDLKRWIGRLIKDPHLGKGDFLKEMRRLLFEIRWQEAEEERKAGRYRSCGERYVELANDHPASERWAQMLHNAAVCFEAAKMLGQAIMIRVKLIKHKPDHRLAKKALLEVGQNYHALAWYSKAAEYYETFARRFSGEPRAPEALQNAIVFRMGRGEHDKALADARLFAKSYGSRPRYASRAAAVHFALGGVHEARGNPGAVVKHYTRYLRRWGRQGGVDRQVRALVTIARTLWKQACPIEGVNGACVKIRRERSKRSLSRRGQRNRRKNIRTHCGPATKMRVTLVKRNPTKVRQARARLARALDLYQRTRTGRGVASSASPEERDKRLLQLRFAAAEARFLQAEARLEDFLRIAFPRHLPLSSRDPRRAARARRDLARFLKDKDRALARARALYKQVITTRVAHWAIAASARIGQLYQSFADALFTAPIPKARIPRAIAANPRGRETFRVAYAERYCADLERAAIPLETRALQGLGACLKTSTKMSWFNEWSTLCERELNQIQPDVNFMAAEIRAQPGYSACRTDRAELITSVK